ncbi:hypothetical protein [Flavilitoribacter nigricans]|uniref:Uncharacterized protein n=1 Tax=Flavilitoribacter nigricans (strain ATCC 23147 / DSM 23189 / NBRC 102662 / NCIMB 1420 / SS-2) TaxID=1122177 RepID=A0A2D0N180_FLAN2|nr:hypothetical protein [Flavilitoribacter nigricans]PHN02302.1 hypothetical protein CRP01_32915 [Flavilitoribacter nigricans DSM 23189 = NBRC 102662]
MSRLLQLSVTDFKLIFREPSLRAFFILPFILFVVFLWFFPMLVDRYDFLQPYVPLILMVGVIENTQLFSFISSMVLIDEKESNVAVNYGIVPIGPNAFVFSRLILPYLITVALNLIFLAWQPFYDFPFGQELLLSVVVSLVVPVYVLALNALVDNRMKGMIYIKAFNMIVLVPLAAFFVPAAYRHLFGLLPTHWIFQGIQEMTEGQSGAMYLTIGLVYLALLLVVATKKFLAYHFR